MNVAQPVVVVGVDGSSCSDRAVSWAENYARLRGARLRLVTAWDFVVGYGTTVVAPIADIEQGARDVLDKAAADVMLDADLVERRLVRGPAGQSLVRESIDAELLVVGSKGHNPMTSMLIGSVSAHCVHHAKPTVVVVR